MTMHNTKFCSTFWCSTHDREKNKTKKKITRCAKNITRLDTVFMMLIL